MNILFTTLIKPAADTTAGGELYLADLIEGLVRAGISPHLVFPDPGQPHRLRLRKYDRAGGFREYEGQGKGTEDDYRQIIQSFGIDIVHFQHFQTLPLSLMRITKEQGRKLVLTVHDYFLWCENFFLLSPLKGDRPSFCFFESDPAVCAECLKRSQRVWEMIYGQSRNGADFTEDSVRQRRSFVSEILSLADRIITPTAYVRDCFLGMYPNQKPDAFAVIGHGTHMERNYIPEACHVSPASLRVAFLGGFKYEKGSAHFNDLLMSFSDKRVFFSVVGDMKDSAAPHQGPPLNLVGRYKRSQLPGILSAEGIDLVLLLSPWAETFSYTLSEATANGIPVIATDLGAFRERVSGEGSGFLVPHEDPIPRTVKLLRDLVDLPDILRFMKDQCRERARTLKDARTMVSEYLALYERLSLPGIRE